MPASALTKAGLPTPKERAFARAYVKRKGNGTKAALDAYDTTSPEVAAQIASQNIRKERVITYLNKVLNDARLDEFTRDHIRREVAQLAFSDDTRADVKTKNLELLAKIDGMMINRSESVNVNVGLTLDASKANTQDLAKSILDALRASSRGDKVDVQDAEIVPDKGMA